MKLCDCEDCPLPSCRPTDYRINPPKDWGFLFHVHAPADEIERLRKALKRIVAGDR